MLGSWTRRRETATSRRSRSAGAATLAALAALTGCLDSGESIEVTRAPRSVQYPDFAPLPIGEPVDIAPTIDGGRPTSWSVSPSLPDGLRIDSAGRITGTPAKTASPGGFTIRAENRFGRVDVKLAIAVLPDDVRGLSANYWVDLVADELQMPVKMQFMDGGRLLFAELRTGRIRAISADGKLEPAPLAVLPVGNGAQAGLLGFAVSPQTTTREIFAHTVGQDDVGRIWKVVEATSRDKEIPVPKLVVDQLPAGSLNNGGDLKFGPQGKLWLSIGDCGVPARAQRDGDLAGRILRFNIDGSIPIDNPISKSAEWCRGLRNAFDLAFHPISGGLFAIDNGVDADDELNFIERGRNYEWPEVPNNSTTPRVGVRLAEWSPAIAPTALAWSRQSGWEQQAGRSLFIASYLDRSVRRLVMSGNAYTDVDSEEIFLRFRDTDAGGNEPLGLAVGPRGHLYISTTNAIWRVVRSSGDQRTVPTIR